jgi:hypothetical protein
MALEAGIAAVAPEFADLQLDSEALTADCEDTDLDAIDRAGALRQAAELLLAESQDENRPEAEREIAGEALVRLFSYCDAMQP